MRECTNPEALGLEENNLAPGHWLIEGYDCRQVMQGGRLWHWEIRPYKGTEVLATPRTIHKCREWIRERKERS
jgi:hypothetical protein